MNSRDFALRVNIGDTVYVNSRAKNHMGNRGVIIEKGCRRATVKFGDGSEKVLSFYSLETKPVVVDGDTYILANNVGNVIACPRCKRALFDYKNTPIYIETAHGFCKFCHAKVKWDLREVRRNEEN